MFNHLPSTRANHIAAILACSMACLTSLVFTPVAHAIINTTGDVTPNYNGQDPWDVPGHTSLIVGDTGTGTLLVESGSDVESGDVADDYIGNEAGANGTVSVYGTGSTWYTDGIRFYIGNYGTGTLTIENGGVVHGSHYSYLGNEVDSAGTVNVNGPGATWSTRSKIHVGMRGTGTLNILNGGLIEAGGATWLGLESTATGVINFDQGTLNTGALAASPSELLGTGTINTQGLLSDVDLVFDATHGMQQQLILNSLPDQNITLNIDVSGPPFRSHLGAGYRGNGSLTIADGLILSTRFGYIGYHSGSMGVATVTGSGSTWNIDRFSVGNRGTGTLIIENGGTVNSNTYSHINSSSGSNSTGTVTGSGSTWNINNEFHVGGVGAGTLNIENGGVVNSSSLSILGREVGSTGSATVTGPGSTWNAGTIYVGDDGSGSLNIENGGAVDGSITLGKDFGSSGAVTITGPGSTLMGSMTVGYRGTGILNIENGGVVTGSGMIGRYSPNGTVTVTGEGSAWMMGDSTLHVGYGGNGTLNIENGGEVNSGSCSIGYDGDSSGTVSISGLGSSWNISGNLTVGYYGDGTLNISDDNSITVPGFTWLGRVSAWNSTGIINFDQGTLNTDGLYAATDELLGTGTINTTWLASDFDLLFDATNTPPTQYVLNSLPGQNITINLDISDPDARTRLDAGYRGTSSITIADGRTISADGGYLGHVAGSVGTATVTGPGSTWDTGSDGIHVGMFGTGVLNIENGGVINSSSSSIGEHDGSVGVVTVDGPGSVWNTSGLDIAGDGTATLDILNGGRVNSLSAEIGYDKDSSGTVTVNGPGSTWDAGDIGIGGPMSSGTLNIENGGVVRSTSASASYLDGTVTVSGPGSTWHHSGRLSAVRYGTLNILNGGQVYLDSEPVAQLTIGSGGSEVNLSSGLLDLDGGQIFSYYGIFNFTGGVLKNAATIDLGQPFVQQGGTLAPGGSIGQTDIRGDYQLTEGTVEIELGGPGNPHDLLTVTGDIDIALLGTTLDMQLIGPIGPGIYSIIESISGSLTGRFENITGLDTFPGQIDVQLQYTATAVMLTIGPFSGDLNGDGFVGIEDLNTILSAWNQSVTPWDLASGDVTGDGFVGIEDLNVVLGNWNTGTPPPPGADVLAAIPEPGTVGLFAMGVLCGCGRRYRSRAA